MGRDRPSVPQRVRCVHAHAGDDFALRGGVPCCGVRRGSGGCRFRLRAAGVSRALPVRASVPHDIPSGPCQHPVAAHRAGRAGDYRGLHVQRHHVPARVPARLGHRSVGVPRFPDSCAWVLRARVRILVAGVARRCAVQLGVRAAPHHGQRASDRVRGRACGGGGLRGHVHRGRCERARANRPVQA